jgi:hypothetical protein
VRAAIQPSTLSTADVCIDASLDHLVDAIDAISWPEFWMWFLVAPSVPLMRVAASLVNDSYIDEFLTWLFFVCSALEVTRTASSLLALPFYCHQHHFKASIFGIVREHLRAPFASFAAVSVVSSVSYCVSVHCP